MATVTYALTTTTKVKLYAGVDSNYTDDDALIDSLVSQVTDFIEAYCGDRRFLSTSYTEVRDSVDGRCVFLDQFPITALTLVEYRGGTPSVPNWITYQADGYLGYLNAGYIKFYARLPTVSQGLRITYTAGYLINFNNELTAAHTLPFDLTQVATELCAKQYNLRKSQGIEKMQTEGQLVVFSNKTNELDNDHKLILDKYQTLRYSI